MIPFTASGPCAGKATSNPPLPSNPRTLFAEFSCTFDRPQPSTLSDPGRHPTLQLFTRVGGSKKPNTKGRLQMLKTCNAVLRKLSKTHNTGETTTRRGDVELENASIVKTNLD